MLGLCLGLGMARGAVTLLILYELAACRAKTPSLENLACSSDACVAGYSCDAVSNLCVKTPVVDCGVPSDLCATAAKTGATCPLAGFQLPCTVLQTDCTSGSCRTCQDDHTWSACPGGGSSGGSSGSSTGPSKGPPGAVLSIVSGSAQGFGVGARAMSVGQVLSGTSKDGSQNVTFGFSAVVIP